MPAFNSGTLWQRGATAGAGTVAGKGQTQDPQLFATDVRKASLEEF